MTDMASEQVVTFQGHHSYIVSIARLCKENGLFTDVTLQCDDGKLLAHRIVLAAVSPFLCRVLGSLSGDCLTTIIVPDIRREVVQQLLDFLYTGIMRVSQSQSRTWELQELVLLLQIDPQNVGVEVLDGGTKYSKLSSMSSVCQTLGIKIASRAEMPPKSSSSPGKIVSQPPKSRSPPAVKTETQPPKLSSPPPVKIVSQPIKSSSPPTMVKPISQSGSPSLAKTVSQASSPPPPPLPKLTIKTDGPVTNGVTRTRVRPLSSRPDYTESPEEKEGLPFTPIRVTTPGSKRGTGGSSRGSHQTSPKGGNRGPHVSPKSARHVSSDSSPSKDCELVSSSGVRPVSGIRLVPSSRLRSSRSSTESDQGDSPYMSVLRPSDNSNVIKIVTNRKRRHDSDDESPSPSAASCQTNGDVRPSKESKSGRGRGLRTRGRARRGRGGGGGGSGSVAPKGQHDMENTQTWVCAICGQYDPQTNDVGETTEWIGCDCNRWFHKFCTKLRTVDDNFSCRQVHKVCLPS